ncbi:hypothetical protein [Actinokineospora sp. UTMC 2448]|uniref:hypothetical protein n=1 Tax=Actinokineospora sp. UTMC 2448 TaxID=2268449 RepID=UPI002164AF44|nr:hypothetical protein [Actinokineospora sp. UTMC 2448]UVS80579.1 hypothetical protein Actkin_04330 [Actinokineospora sp. UTMC 2448]
MSRIRYSATRPRGLIGGCVLALLAAGYMAGTLTTGDSVQIHTVSGLPMRNGVPIDDRRTAAGAVTAAQNFQIAGFRVSAGTLDAHAAADELLAPLADDNARQVLTPSLTDPGPTRTAYAPVSAVVLSHTPHRAEVQVWGVAATSALNGKQPEGTETWGRSVVTLIWAGDRWRVQSQRFDPGPWPVRADARLAESAGDFSFRAAELRQPGWSYVP